MARQPAAAGRGRRETVARVQVVTCAVATLAATGPSSVICGHPDFAHNHGMEYQCPTRRYLPTMRISARDGRGISVRTYGAVGTVRAPVRVAARSDQRRRESTTSADLAADGRKPYATSRMRSAGQTPTEPAHSISDWTGTGFRYARAGRYSDPGGSASLGTRRCYSPRREIGRRRSGSPRLGQALKPSRPWRLGHLTILKRSC